MLKISIQRAVSKLKEFIFPVDIDLPAYATKAMKNRILTTEDFELAWQQAAVIPAKHKDLVVIRGVSLIDNNYVWYTGIRLFNRRSKRMKDSKLFLVEDLQLLDSEGYSSWSEVGEKESITVFNSKGARHYYKQMTPKEVRYMTSL